VINRVHDAPESGRQGCFATPHLSQDEGEDPGIGIHHLLIVRQELSLHELARLEVSDYPDNDIRNDDPADNRQEAKSRDQ